MTDSLPIWWLVLSGLFFFTNIVLFVALAFAAVRLARIVQELRPKVDEIGKKVGAISVKVEGIAKNVEDLTESVKGTVTQLGGRATNVAGSVELVANSASRQFERFAPFITGALTAIRLAKALGDMRGGRSLAKATTAKSIDSAPAKGRGKLFGLF